MERLIECDTCGYPLLPEEREGLVEINGKMCKRQEPLTDAEIEKLMTATWGSASIAPQSVPDFARAIERELGFAKAELWNKRINDAVLAEREACAELAEKTICDTHTPTGVNIYGTRAAKAIRARGEK